jgi:hypothetical protein
LVVAHRHLLVVAVDDHKRAASVIVGTVFVIVGRNLTRRAGS